VTPANAGALLECADGLIVGSNIKRRGVWSNPIDPARCRDLVRAVKGTRAGSRSRG
jgi:predicted TIM-barrel enzyme